MYITVHKASKCTEYNSKLQSDPHGQWYVVPHSDTYRCPVCGNKEWFIWLKNLSDFCKVGDNTVVYVCSEECKEVLLLNPLVYLEDGSQHTRNSTGT